MEKKKIKGVWIPIEILDNSNLADKEKILFSIILGLSLESGFCYANNRYLGKILNITTGRVSKLISALKQKELIDVKLIYENDSKKIERREIRPMVIFNHTPSRKELYPIVKNNKDIKNIYNKLYNNKRMNFEQREYTMEELKAMYANYK